MCVCVCVGVCVGVFERKRISYHRTSKSVSFDKTMRCLLHSLISTLYP